MHQLLAAFRQFRKSAGLSLTIVLTIALGIGANTAIFTLVHAVLLRSLPVKEPGMLYMVGSDQSEGGVRGGLTTDGKMSLFSYELYKEVEQATPQFSQLAAVQSGGPQTSVREGGQPGKELSTEFVSGNYFQTLGIGAFSGRVFSAQDDAAAAAPAAVISYASWQGNFGSDPKIVGKTLSFQGHPVTVVGIAPPGFYGDRLTTSPSAFWLPLSLEPTIQGAFSILRSPTINWLYLIGRVKPGTSLAALASQMTTNVRAWLATQPDLLKNGGMAAIAKQRIELVSGGGGIQQMQQQQKSGLYLLMAISALVLLVACANVANLLLARGTAQRASTSLRMALGASRAVLIRQMLLESVVLAFVGGVAGLAVAYGGTRTILNLAFPNSPQLPIHATPSLPVLGFAFLLSLATGVIFGVVPAWITSHADPAEALRGANRSTRDKASLPQRSLTVFQAALSLILLVGAGLLTRSLVHLQEQDFGFKTENRYVVQFDPAGAGYKVGALPALYQQIEERFGTTPGVAHAGLALYSPMSGTLWASGIEIPGKPLPKLAFYDRVTPQFLTAAGEPVLRGRAFNDEDTATSQNVAVVNESFAKGFFPGQDPLGRTFGAEGNGSANHTIVGVVRDAKYADATAPANKMFFLPLVQRVPGLSPSMQANEERSMYATAILLDFKSQPGNVDQMARQTLAEINPNLTVGSVQTLSYQVNGSFTENKLISRLATLFGLLALVLAGVGLYGITSYQVTRRTSEIGLRMALGATRGDVLLMVLRSAFTQVGLGLAIGIPAAILLAHLIASQLYGLRIYDPVSFVLAIAALAAAAALAGLIPARRAASIEPVTALRVE
jgi:predicted permease